MKQLLLVFAVTVIAFPSLAMGSYYYDPHTYTFTGLHTPKHSYDYPSPSFKYDPPSLEPPKHSEPYQQYDHRKDFMGPPASKLLQGADLHRSEVVKLVGSSLGTLMSGSIARSHESGLEEWRDISMALVGAARNILETRVRNGQHVSEKEFEDLRGIEQRVGAVMDAITATFDEKANTIYSLTNFFKTFNFDDVERVKYMGRVLPGITKTVLQGTDTTTAENFSNAYNIFLPATRKFMEERRAAGKPITQEHFRRLERAEKLMPSLMQAFVHVSHDPLLIEFQERMNLDPKERAIYLVDGFFASMDAIFKDTSASVPEMMRDVTLAYMAPSRRIFEDRLAQGKPVTQENFDNLERMEKTLPIIFDTYVQIMDDLGLN